VIEGCETGSPSRVIRIESPSPAALSKGSSLHHLKELRPGSTGSTEIRVVFAFDPERNAVLLVAGDKSGQWTEWYRRAIPLAEERYALWLVHLAQRRQKET
jgi:hypothetical protein